VINKIEGPGSVRPTQTIRRAGKTGAAGGVGFAKHLDETSEAGSSHGISGTGAVSGVLGVQEVDDALAHASRGKLRAQDILDRLEDLRLELLTGTISRDKLLQLTHVVSARRGQVTDPRLAEILDEIDLRAQVELAKYVNQGLEARG
jgi:hypothetical protein